MKLLYRKIDLLVLACYILKDGHINMYLISHGLPKTSLTFFTEEWGDLCSFP